MQRKRIVLGTRGSDLARAQAAMVERALRSALPALDVAIEIITTRGDEKSGAPEVVVDRHAGRKGMFTAEIERALLDRRIDVAVHSAKDLPSDATAGLQVCAALPRAAIEDVLITKEALDLESLPRGGTIATGSVRRQRQLHWLRPDLELADLRGNVPTRLRKLTESAWDGIILARAGLERLGFDCSRGNLASNGQALRATILSTEKFLPAGGQGIVALQIRANDGGTRQVISAANNEDALRCLRAEREFLRLLQGDCGTPVGVLAVMNRGMLSMRAQLFNEPDGGEPRTASVEQTQAGESPESLGGKLLELING